MVKKHASLSDTLNSIFNNLEDSTTLETLMKTLKGRSYGILMLLLALPNLIPMPTPGLSAIVGAPLVIILAQAVLGIKAPWLPNFLAKKKFKATSLKRSYKKIERYINWLEVIMKPRLQFLVRHPAERFIAAICLIMALLILLPVPFGNAFPAFTICLLALALLMGDGLFVVFGVLSALASGSVIIAVMKGALSGIQALFS